MLESDFFPFFFFLIFFCCRYGVLKVLAEEIGGGDDDVTIQLSGAKLPTKDWMGKGDHYYKVITHKPKPKP